MTTDTQPVFDDAPIFAKGEVFRLDAAARPLPVAARDAQRAGDPR